MRNIYLFFICVVISSTQLFAESDRLLEDAVKDYQSLQKELDALLKIKSPSCSPGTKLDPAKTFCSLKDICSSPAIHIDDPILYQNAKGEKISNDEYYQDRADVRACLREKYADEIRGKRDELTSTMGAKHLKKIIAANKKLTKLADIYREGAKIQKISAEILNMSLEIGMSGESSVWETSRVDRRDLTAFISKAESRTKIKLNPAIKKTLVEIQYLKKNHLYADEIDKMDAALIPEVKPKDPFFDWDQLLDELAAGGARALLANRARLTQKTQDAYVLFQETQKEMISYLETKKTESNVDKIERIIERVKTIRFNPPRLTATLKDHCQYPNAFYSADDHSFTVCPQVLDYPKMALMEIMAHEITHSYDSCNLSGKMYKTRGPLIVEDAPFEIDIKMDPILGNYKNTFDADPSDTKNRIQDKMKYADNPFSKTLSCLQDPKSVGAESLSPSEIAQKAKENLAELTRLGQNNPNNAKARYLNFLLENQKDYFDYFEGCDLSSAGIALGRSQLQEAFADKIASEIVARKLRSAGKAEAEKSLLEITLTYGNICSNEGNDSSKLRAFAIKEGCPNYIENKTQEQNIITALKIAEPAFDPHPESTVRIERNLLAQPDIRKALGCPEVKGTKYCE